MSPGLREVLSFCIAQPDDVRDIWLSVKYIFWGAMEFIHDAL